MCVGLELCGRENKESFRVFVAGKRDARGAMSNNGMSMSVEESWKKNEDEVGV